MPISVPTSDLDRCVTHDADNVWPEKIEIVAYWGRGRGRRGTRVTATISGDDFFGLSTGAPMSGDHLIGIIDRLRKSHGK